MEVRQTENPENPGGTIHCCVNSRPRRDVCRKLPALSPESPSKARWKRRSQVLLITACELFIRLCKSVHRCFFLTDGKLQTGKN